MKFGVAGFIPDKTSSSNGRAICRISSASELGENDTTWGGRNKTYLQTGGIRIGVRNAKSPRAQKKARAPGGKKGLNLAE